MTKTAPPSAADVRNDLIAEQNALHDALRGLTVEQWATPTTSPRWTVADQIGHLAYFDQTAALAITNPDGFRDHVTKLMPHFGSDEALDNATLGAYRAMPPAELLATWQDNQNTLAAASAQLSNDDRVIWYGPSMGAKSFLTARLMECWAHGQDIVEVTSIDVAATDRLAHIARLGFITRSWSYINRKLEAPETDVSVTLHAPSGDEWNYGNADAAESITGDAEDFCLVVTQRRHVDDTNLVVNGDAARDWMLLAQAFAGPATTGPSARN